MGHVGKAFAIGAGGTGVLMLVIVIANLISWNVFMILNDGGEGVIARWTDISDPIVISMIWIGILLVLVLLVGILFGLGGRKVLRHVWRSIAG